MVRPAFLCSTAAVVLSLLCHFAQASEPPQDSLPPTPAGKVWKLVWHDEFDGKETWRTKAGGVCQVPVYIKLSDEIGPWAGDIKKAKLPDETPVDYVRVYDLEAK